jgi:hypothetical protein
MSRGGTLAAILAAAILGPSALSAVNIPVTNTNDSGAGSLRAAITQANMDAVSDNITFNIPGPGVHTIAPTSPLPTISQPVTIDGYTQPGSSPNTGVVGQPLNGVLTIEIDCTNAGSPCIDVTGNDVTLRGLVVNNSVGAGFGIWTVGGERLVVEGCYIGTAPDGMSLKGAGSYAVLISLPGARIGGTTPAARNLIARGTDTGLIQTVANNTTIQGNLFCTDRTGEAIMPGAPLTGLNYPVLLVFGSSTNLVGGTAPGAGNVFACGAGGPRIEGGGANSVIQGNFIGVNGSATRLLSLGRVGTGILTDAPVTIGGSTPGAGNVIGGYTAGISLGFGDNNVVQGNSIGTDPTGVRDFGNDIAMSMNGNNNTIGGTGAGEGNIIRNNRRYGVGVLGTGSFGNTIRGNRISGNGLVGDPSQLGIDMDANGVTPNDLGDGDTGANGFQNFPEIASALPEGGGTRVMGTLNSVPSTQFTIDFYWNPACRPRAKDPLEGDTYLGTTMVTTDAGGTVPINVLLPTPIPAGALVTATATAPDGSTSEFSQEIIHTATPVGGNSTGGSNIVLKGMYFQAPATVTVGGVPSPFVNVQNATTLNFTAPALPAGTVHDIVVSTGGRTGRLRNGYVSYFVDDGTEFPAKMLANQVTAGCGGGFYCGGSPVTRAQMAVFLLIGRRGACYVPPPATGTVFNDVPLGSFAASFIEALAAAQVTSGCGGGNYCPEAGVTRESMAVFILRMADGPEYVPPPCTTATFNDVPCSSVYARWIYELVRRQITAGCGGGNYCPADIVSRFQMAVFLSTAFGLT